MLNRARLLEAHIMRGHMHGKACAFLVFFLLFVSVSASALYAESEESDESRLWSQLLSAYVNSEGLVRYEDWKMSTEGLAQLEKYLDFVSNLNFNEEKKDSTALSTLINGYNALVIREVLKNYPIESIQAIPRFFTIKHKFIAGKQVSLNELEEWIRSFGDYRVHAGLVCGSRSSPPLLAEPYVADALNAQLDAQMRKWLGRADLNHLDVTENVLYVSKLFNWYKRDFGTSDEALYQILIRFNPNWLTKDNIKREMQSQIEFKDFDWALNETKMQVAKS